MDPISDRFPWVSTYNYAENEPVGSIDLHGLQKAPPLNPDGSVNVKAFKEQHKWIREHPMEAASPVLLVIPGPEDVVLAGFLATKAGQGLARLGAKALDGILSWRKGKGKIPQGPGAKGSKSIEMEDEDDLIHGTGSFKGVIEIGGDVKSLKAFNSLEGESIDFVFDPLTGRMAVMSNKSITGGHDYLRKSIKGKPENIVGGRLTKGRNSQSIETDEWSGHYGDQWTPEIRQQFKEYLENMTGSKVNHTEWQ